MDLCVTELMFFMYVKEMIIPGSPHWPVGFALHVGDVHGDTEAMKAAEETGIRVAELAKTISANPQTWMKEDSHTDFRPAFGDDWR